MDDDTIGIDEAVLLTAQAFGIDTYSARLMIRDAVAKGELIGFRERGGRIERMTPDDIERMQ